MADLLSPRGTHGQGKVFLDLFLDVIGHPELAVNSGRAWVQCEIPTLEDRRIDFTLCIDRFAIGVENKPWAGDQVNQLHDYAADLRKRYSDFHLVYVSSSGEPPSSESISHDERHELEQAGRFKTVSYAGEIKSWLRACHEVPNVPEEVAWFIEEFITFIAVFILGKDMTDREKREILDHAFEDGERLRLALMVGAAFQDLRARLFAERTAEVRRRIEAKTGPGWEFRTDVNSHGGFYFYFRKSSWPKQLEAGFGQDSAKGAFYSFLHRWKAPQRSPVDDRLAEALEPVIGRSGQPTDNCCWWRYLDERYDWNRMDVLEQLAVGSEEPVEYIADLLDRMRIAIEPIVEQEIV